MVFLSLVVMVITCVILNLSQVAEVITTTTDNDNPYTFSKSGVTSHCPSGPIFITGLGTFYLVFSLL